ncbi:MAG: hypothetical protein V2A34_02330 [Lentisphaerota bacterium]
MKYTSRLRAFFFLTGFAALVMTTLCAKPALALPSEDSAAAEYMPMVNTYLKCLSEGRYEDSLASVDFRAMADYLIQRRMMEVRQQNPALSPEEEAAMIQGFREKDVSPDRLKTVTLDMLKEQKLKGMTWTFKQVAKPEKIPNSLILTFEASIQGAKPKTVPLGLQKVGPKWYVAPQLMEQLMAPIKAEPVKPSEAALLFGGQYWNLWKSGEMEKAYELFGPAMKKQVTLLNYLETTSKIIGEFGILISWKMVESYALPQNQVSLIYDLEFSNKKARSLVTMREDQSAWSITGFQFLKSPGQQPVPTTKPSAPAPATGL